MIDNQYRKLGLIAVLFMTLLLVAGCASGKAEIASAERTEDSVPAETIGMTQTESEQESVPESREDETLNTLKKAEAFYHGSGEEYNQEKALEYYRAADALGSAYGKFMCAELTFLLDDGNDPSLYDQMIEKISQAYLDAYAMPEEDPEGRIILGLYASMMNEYDQAILYLEDAANRDSFLALSAMTGAADAYQGRGNQNDYVQAEYWYRKAAESGSRHAILSLANHYQMYLNDQEKAIEWYERALEEGFRVWYSIGTSYSLPGPMHSDQTALTYHEKGYENGINACAYAIGVIYYGGSDVEQDPQKALEYFSRYLNGRVIRDPEHYQDWNEKQIRKIANDMLQRGIFDKAAIESYLGEGFLDRE